MPPRPKKPSSKLPNQLLEAITFLSIVTKEKGAPSDTHIFLHDKVCTAYNEILSAGILIEEEIACAPNNKIFQQALSKCGEGYTLSIDGTKIIVKSGKFKAIVPCIDPSILFNPYPDQPSFMIDDRLKEALACVDIIKSEPNAEKVHLLAFLLNGQSIINTDGKIIIEYWHGIDLPTLAIPRIIIPGILGNSKKLSQFGFSETSVTFFFEDKSWIKSQLYNKPYPIELTQNVLNKPSNPVPIPSDFYKGLDAINSFSENGTVWFERELLCSHKSIETGATFEVPGLPKGPIYSIKYLLMIKNIAERIDFTVPGMQGSYYMSFFGKNIRGIIAGHG